MVVGTRSGSKSPVKNVPSEAPIVNAIPQQIPMKHFILPKGVSDRARFLTLPHPRDATEQRFFLCPEKGLYHFTQIGGLPTEVRSLLFTQPISRSIDVDSDSSKEPVQDSQDLSRGYVSQAADFLLATPFDLAFLLTPLIMPRKPPTGKHMFQPVDDMLDEVMRDIPDLKYLIEHGRSMVEEAMTRFCDSIEAGDEKMFRPNEEEILQMILGKVDTAIHKGLPSTLEERFVTRPLEAPFLSVKREEAAVTTVQIKTRSVAPDEDGEDDEFDNFDSQSSAASTTATTVFSEASVASSTSTIIPEPVAPELLQLQRQSTVLDFILESYVPVTLADRLRERLKVKNSPANFTLLEEHKKSLATLKAEALSSRSITDFSRKRSLEDDETTEIRAEKKKKQEEEDRKKRLGESNGLRALKKVNVSGMKKMSDFFSKKAATKVG